MKKSCDNCKALSLGDCQLGYKQKSIFNKLGNRIIEKIKPAEDCPKPLTIKKFISIYAHKTN